MNFGRVFLSWCLRAYVPHIPLLFLLLFEHYTRPISSPGDPPQVNPIAGVLLMLGIPCAWIFSGLLLGQRISFSWLQRLGTLRTMIQPRWKALAVVAIIIATAVCLLNTPVWFFLADIVLLSVALFMQDSFSRFSSVMAARAEVHAYYETHSELHALYPPQRLLTEIRTRIPDLPSTDPWTAARDLLKELQALVETVDRRERPARLADPVAARIQQLRLDSVARRPKDRIHRRELKGSGSEHRCCKKPCWRVASWRRY